MPEATKNVLPGIFARYKITSFSPNPNTNPSDFLFTGEYNNSPNSHSHTVPHPDPTQRQEEEKKVSKKSLRIQEVPFNSTENQCVSLCHVFFFFFVISSLSRELSKIVHSHVSQFANSIMQPMQLSFSPQPVGL